MHKDWCDKTKVIAHRIYRWHFFKKLFMVVFKNLKTHSHTQSDSAESMGESTHNFESNNTDQNPIDCGPQNPKS